MSDPKTPAAADQARQTAPRRTPQETQERVARSLKRRYWAERRFQFYGMAAVFLALIPFAFALLGWREEAIWRTCSGPFAFFEIAFIATHYAPARRFIREHRELFNLGLLTFVTFGHAVNCVAQLLSATGVFERTSAVYVFGLLWILFHSAFQFGRILFVQPASAGAMSTTWTKPADQSDAQHPK